MSSVAMPIATTISGATSQRAQALAERLELGAHALALLASSLTTAEWHRPLPGDGRPIGVVIHHVASVYPVEIHLAQVIASGQAMTGVSMADVHAMNAQHAIDHRGATPEATIHLLRHNSAAAADAIRGLSDEELNRAAPASLYGDAPVTTQFVLEDHAVRHSYHHLARIRAALKS